MTASFVPSPEGALEAAIAGIRKRAATRGFLTPNLQKANPKALQLCVPHRLAFVALNDLLAGETLRGAARISGWRFFIIDSSSSAEPIAAAHVMQTDKGEIRLSELNEGQFVGGSLNALKVMLAKPKTRSKDNVEIPVFEPLLLVAPAVYFVGWWARLENEHDDWVLPVSPTVQKLDGTPIPSSKLLPALREEFIRASRDR